jgi:signal recognition particle subunit SRP68
LLLQSKLASLAAEAQVVQAAATSSFEWRGMRCGLALEKLRVPLHSAKELASSLGSAMETGGCLGVEN